MQTQLLKSHTKDKISCKSAGIEAYNGLVPYYVIDGLRPMFVGPGLSLSHFILSFHFRQKVPIFNLLFSSIKNIHLWGFGWLRYWTWSCTGYVSTRLFPLEYKTSSDQTLAIFWPWPKLHPQTMGVKRGQTIFYPIFTYSSLNRKYISCYTFCKVLELSRSWASWPSSFKVMMFFSAYSSKDNLMALLWLNARVTS